VPYPLADPSDFVKARLGGVEVSLDALGVGRVSVNGHPVNVRGVTLRSHAGKFWEVLLDVAPVKPPDPREA
jgi:hypothetical protein